MRSRIRTIKNISETEESQDKLISFEKAVLNTNYIAPQILKSIDSVAYNKVLYSSLYQDFNEKKTSSKYNKEIEDTNLYQVARIMARQHGNSRVLTFNYDNVLELVIGNNFNKNIQTRYRYSRANVVNPKIEIVHSHGYLPFSEDKMPAASSIVLSSHTRCM